MGIKKYLFLPAFLIMTVLFFSAFAQTEEITPDVVITLDNGTYSGSKFEAEASVIFNKPELYNDSVKFSYHIYDPSGVLIRWEGVRIPFALDDRNGRIAFEIERETLDLPKDVNEFTIKPDLIDEKNLFWFDGNPEITSAFPSVTVRLEPVSDQAMASGTKSLLRNGVENSFGDSASIVGDTVGSSVPYVIGNQKIQLLLNLLAIIFLIFVFILYKRREKIAEPFRAEDYVLSKKAHEPMDIVDGGDIKKTLSREKTLFSRIADFFYGPVYERLDIIERETRSGRKKLNDLYSGFVENNLAHISKLDNIMGKLETLEYISVRNLEYLKTKIETLEKSVAIVGGHGEEILQVLKALDHTIVANFDLVKNGQELLERLASASGEHSEETLLMLKAMDHTIVANFDLVKNGQELLERLASASGGHSEETLLMLKAMDHTIVANFDLVKNGQELLERLASASGEHSEETLLMLKAMDHTIVANFDKVKSGQESIERAAASIMAYGEKTERSLQGLEYITVNNFDQVKNLCSAASVQLERLKKEIAREAERTAEAVFIDSIGMRPWKEKKYPSAARRIYDAFFKSFDCEDEFRYFEQVPLEFLKEACGSKKPRVVYGVWAREAAEIIGAQTALKPFWSSDFVKSHEGDLCPVSLLPDFMGDNASLVVTNPHITDVLCSSSGILEAVRDRLKESAVLCASFGVKRLENLWINFGTREGEKGEWRKWAVNFNEDSSLVIYNNSDSELRGTLKFALFSVQKNASVAIETAAGKEVFTICDGAREISFPYELKPGRNELRFCYGGSRDTVPGDWRELKFSITNPVFIIEEHEKTIAVDLLERDEVNAAYLDDFIRQRLHTAGFYTIEARICARGGLYVKDMPSSSFAFLSVYDIGRPSYEIIYKAASELCLEEIPVVYTAYRKDSPRG